MNKCIENHSGLCFSCLNNFNPKVINNIIINPLGYGGAFDEFSSQIQLCPECMSKTNPEWWKFRVIKCSSGFGTLYERYEYEEDIMNFVESFPLAGQELFYNSCSSDKFKLEPQDWIDFTTGNLSDEKIKYYGLDLRGEE